MANPVSNTLRKSVHTVDRTALILILVLSLVILFFLLKGDRTAARVRDFSWQGRQVGAEDSAFILTFSRPMDQVSVEQNLQLEPPLPGKFSWAGRRMAYTLETPAPYGQTFEVRLDAARDRLSQWEDSHTQIQPFTGQFQTRDRAFVYLGVQGEESGRLVLQNLTRQQKQILTPENLNVIDFKPYPEGDRILFSATERTSDPRALLDQQLYSVTTGIHLQSPATTPGQLNKAPSPQPSADQPAGTIERVLDNKDYQNLKFDLSPDGQTIAVQRINKQQQFANVELWILQAGQPPKPLETQGGGEFLIAPDSQSLAMLQGQGTAILSFESGAEPLDFLPKYGLILNFANDGTAAAMVKFNTDPKNPTRSLFLVTNQGTEKELLKTNGSILNAQFDPMKQTLYCLYTTLVSGSPEDAYLEQPYLSGINLETGKRVDLLELPRQQDIQISLAPDGLGILFDQAVADGTGTGVVRGRDGRAIANSQLWFLPLRFDNTGIPAQTQPQELEISGLRPRWLP
ncbi:MAG: hypothetical protein HC769_14655 [Cyanobacteria bacterium CRU_2_1]|nr:hypothetical protein [Cyanobacteria bacterium RU_5_0]NJR59965.1 hypothetical protein [Cyanobacteria bacterium CRU_2_1]